MSWTGPRAVYAQILDGENLWVAVSGAEPVGATLALKGADTGPLAPIRTDVERHGEGSLLVGRTNLPDLLGPGEGSNPVEAELVVVHPSAAGVAQLQHVGLGCSTRSPGPTTTPDASADSCRYTVEPGADRRVVVRRQPVPPAARLDGVDVENGRVRLGISLPGRTAAAEQLRIESEASSTEVARVPVVEESGRWLIWLTRRDVMLQAGDTARFYLDTPDGPMTIQRRRNDLREPRLAVPMPIFDLPDEEGQIRLLFKVDGSLAARRPLPGTAA